MARKSEHGLKIDRRTAHRNRIIVVLSGLLVMFGGLSWFGRLPGDIRVEWRGGRLHVPLVSMLIVSLVLTVALNLLRRFFQ